MLSNRSVGTSLFRELDERLKLSSLSSDYLKDYRKGKNSQHGMQVLLYNRYTAALRGTMTQAMWNTIFCDEEDEQLHFYYSADLLEIVLYNREHINTNYSRFDSTTSTSMQPSCKKSFRWTGKLCLLRENHLQQEPYTSPIRKVL